MDLTHYFGRKRALDPSPSPSPSPSPLPVLSEDDDDDDDDDLQPSVQALTSPAELMSSCSSPVSTVPRQKSMSKGEKKRAYKARLSYKSQWEQKYPWVYCSDVKQGMFCKLCQERGNPPAPTARGERSQGLEPCNGVIEAAQ
jgi:hypothetical protein